MFIHNKWGMCSKLNHAWKRLWYKHGTCEGLGGFDDEGLPAVRLQGGKGELADIWDVVDAQPLQAAIRGHCCHRQVRHPVAAPDGQALHSLTDCKIIWYFSMRSAGTLVLLVNSMAPHFCCGCVHLLMLSSGLSEGNSTRMEHQGFIAWLEVLGRFVCVHLLHHVAVLMQHPHSRHVMMRLSDATGSTLEQLTVVSRTCTSLTCLGAHLKKDIWMNKALTCISDLQQ